ncbi:hypothetical protein CCACVL1_01094 [Corchorus capsularis]|uniref:Uncharacterized protein n=1 Tax=Corchorus capsularis TaxID=210143 RepID=A0A1R3KP16_COCAP|nr:hypothetical protein CCACVL1_01094 [Corchorus capsularis]
MAVDLVGFALICRRSQSPLTLASTLHSYFNVGANNGGNSIENTTTAATMAAYHLLLVPCLFECQL